MVGPLEEWFHVTFDKESIFIHIHAPEQEEVKTSLIWSEIIRVCFKAGDFLDPDEVYIFVSSRPESYLIPTWADGGSNLWEELIKRELFDANLALRAALSSDGKLFCWPEIEQET
ncbi:MAG: hypothetical protein ACW98Y_16730 [Candidatus Thorarchaeota archaeon]|jgi:hypothetical protein